MSSRALNAFRVVIEAKGQTVGKCRQFEWRGFRIISSIEDEAFLSRDTSFSAMQIESGILFFEFHFSIRTEFQFIRTCSIGVFKIKVVVGKGD